MRLFLIFSVFFLFGGSAVFAQDSSALPDLPETQAEAPAFPEENEPEEETIFAKASDANIKESQRFYRYCTKNETLSAEKDCKCAATRYLETRLKLGDEASANQIMANNRNTCLLGDAQVIIRESSIDLSELTDAQIKETEEVYEYCSTQRGYSTSYDCRCFAAKFLGKRLEQGPLIPRLVLFAELKNDCRNIVETTGAEYSVCMSSPSFSDTGGIQQKKFCECYARQWAKSFESFQGNLSRNAIMNMKVGARMYCKQPEPYQK